MDEIAENTIVCSRCGSGNSAGRFFCYTCGNYFLGAENGNGADGSEKEEQPGIVLSTPQAKVIMPGGVEIPLSGTPTFIERSNFDGTLPRDILMSISRQHLLITCDNGTYYIQDWGRDGKGSTNHTKLNNVDIYNKGRQALKDGDRIELSLQPELTLTFKLMQC
ncbi:MAG: FHA domain-containing protein [Dehalococcoidia bacterium]